MYKQQQKERCSKTPRTKSFLHGVTFFLPGASKKNKNLLVTASRPCTEKVVKFNIKLLSILLRKGAENFLEKEFFPFFLLNMHILGAHTNSCPTGHLAHLISPFAVGQAGQSASADYSGM
ncbi:hypothetical protein AVEN_252150-1 [Araneus ventricosus]|uniref:Uncharacterized protein n=1 Tax=Araneus ventricosus TaxID=182803 RepID=A0A4Y2L1W5_ARAVE|nr:hypothetical protein AVEN_252150-1 [Araneus ventricosus]